jgi:hypothetical protein
MLWAREWEPGKRGEDQRNYLSALILPQMPSSDTTLSNKFLFHSINPNLIIWSGKLNLEVRESLTY